MCVVCGRGEEVNERKIREIKEGRRRNLGGEWSMFISQILSQDVSN